MKSILFLISVYVYLLIGIFFGKLLNDEDKVDWFVAFLWPAVIPILIAIGILGIPVKLADAIRKYFNK